MFFDNSANDHNIESQYFLINDIDREDLILLEREFQSLIEEGKMNLNKRMYDRKE